MLEAEEVDDDYFTPVAKTSLAHIFKKPLTGEISDNESLKYSPPMLKPTQCHEDPQQAKRVFENIFSCVFDAYLWVDHVYTHRGKLGCAVVKVTTDGPISFHNILLYDSKKTTVSSATVTKELEVTLKGKDFISYYDSHKKYWCLYGSENDIQKIIEILKTCHVNIKGIESENKLPEDTNCELNTAKINENKKGIESDTDSSINRKTKASILNRMANMGQSVLPTRAISHEQTSDSSDTNESENHLIAIRHKPVKNIVKKCGLEKNMMEHHLKPDALKKAVVPLNLHTTESNHSKAVSDQLMSLQGTSTMACTTGNDLNYFMTEQRITNSELRINMTRMSDKVDKILCQINRLDTKDNNDGNINTEILQKLLREYETKIKTYEDLLKEKSRETCVLQNRPTNELLDSKHDSVSNEKFERLQNEITELNESIKQKDLRLSVLDDEIKLLKESNNMENFKDIEDKLKTKLYKYEQVFLENQQVISKITTEKDKLIQNHGDEVEQKIKKIMNDTFRAIEVNFNGDETYSGTAIKQIIATVIKKVTIESLSK